MLRVTLAVVVLIAATAAARADLQILPRKTQNVTCSQGTCTATAAKAVLGVSDLTALLAARDVVVDAGVAANVKVGASFSWASTSNLTLTASGAILVKKEVSDAGSGALLLNGALSFGPKGDITFLGLTNRVTINGDRYTLVGDIATLASDIAAKPTGFYALAHSYDASVDGVYAQAPVAVTFMGKFEGLGNAISHLQITNSQGAVNLGLFSRIDGTTVGGNTLVADLKLEGVRIQAGTAFVGALVGTFIVTTVRGVSVSGKISTVGGEVGGLTSDADGGSMANVVNTADITAGDGAIAGGIAGMITNNATLSDAQSKANIIAGADAYIGGIAAENYGVLTRASATGKITGGDGSISGGLVGYNGNAQDASIADSVAHVDMSSPQGDAVIGGLVGDNSAEIVNSHATGTVSEGPNEFAGGLAGTNVGEHGSEFASIAGSYATGAVTVKSSSTAGGLVGRSGFGPITASFATGAVQAGDSSNLGGLVGRERRPVANSYAEGQVTSAPPPRSRSAV